MDGVVVRTLVCHQCDLDLILKLHVVCGLSLLLGSLLCFERFFSGYSNVFLSSKTNISKSQLDLERTDTSERVLMSSLVLGG